MEQLVKVFQIEQKTKKSSTGQTSISVGLKSILDRFFPEKTLTPCHAKLRNFTKNTIFKLCRSSAFLCLLLAILFLYLVLDKFLIFWTFFLFVFREIVSKDNTNQRKDKCGMGNRSM